MFKEQENEWIQERQREFLVACALGKLDSDRIDNIIYSIEKIRREVIR